MFKIKFVEGDYVSISNNGLMCIDKTCNGRVNRVYGVYVLKAYDDVICRLTDDEPFEDDTVYVVKQSKWYETAYTLIHELLHVITVKTIGKNRGRKITKWIDKHLS